MIITCMLAPPRCLQATNIPQRKKGPGRSRKATHSVLKSFKKQIIKKPAITAGQLRATAPEVSTLSDHSVQQALRGGRSETSVDGQNEEKASFQQKYIK